MVDCVVAPFDQVFPDTAEEVSVTEPPLQNVVPPPAVIVGVGRGLTVTTVAVEVNEQLPLFTVTV